MSWLPTNKARSAPLYRYGAPHKRTIIDSAVGVDGAQFLIVWLSE